MRLHQIVISSVAGLVLTTPARAQDVTTGARVRITAPAAGVIQQVGVIASTSRDSFVVELEDGRTIARLAQSGSIIEVSRGRNVTGGAIRGFIEGGLMGFASSYTTMIGINWLLRHGRHTCATGVCYEVPIDDGLKLKTAISFGAAGALLGAVAEAMDSKEEWHPVGIASVRPIVDFSGDRPGLGLSVRF